MIIENAKGILAVNLGGIGDILLSTPALRALRQAYPTAFIALLVHQGCYELARDLVYLDRIYVLHIADKGCNPLTRPFLNAKMLYALRMRHFDAAINMRTIASPRGARRIRRLFAFIGPRVKVGRDTDGRGGFFDIKVPERLSGDMFEMEYDIATARAVGAETLDRHVDFIIDTDSVQRVRLLLNEAGVVANPELVGIHIGGKPSHQWPPGQFREVMRKIHSQVPCTFVITGEAADRAHARALVRTKGIPVVNLAGRLSIRELGALIRMCRLYISNDTAPMHIAAILKVPLVAIFGPGYLKRFDPRCISDKAIVLYRGAECAPCDARICLRKKCLTAISPDEVTEAVLALLRREPGGLS